jgi:cobalt/nickel transport system ATP-binding protein
VAIGAREWPCDLLVADAGDDAPMALRVEELSYAYPDGHVALRDVSLRMWQGEKVALVGPNGAGKSTLLLQLNGILQGQGNIEVCGLPLAPQTLRAVRARVGLVFQNPDDQLFSPTVLDDVSYGPLHMGLPQAEVRERSVRALAQVGMAGYAERLSHHLSVGEKKRVAIATVLSMEPALLVFDEPTAGLDPRARRSLIALLRDLPHTMLVSTHDMRMVEMLFGRTIVMDGGRVVFDGSTTELLADEQLLETHGLERG